MSHKETYLDENKDQLKTQFAPYSTCEKKLGSIATALQTLQAYKSENITFITFRLTKLVFYSMFLFSWLGTYLMVHQLTVFHPVDEVKNFANLITSA